MKLPKFNQSGIAHILAPLLFIIVFAGIGGYILMQSKAAELKAGGCPASAPNPTITPNEDTAFANSVGYVTIDVAVPKCKHAIAVEWYRNGKWLGALTTHTPATAKYGYENHFYSPWRISHASAGSYHWVAKIHNRQGAFFAANNQGDKYLDLLVIGNGGLENSSFIIPDNNAVWKRCDNSKFLRVEVVHTTGFTENPYGGDYTKIIKGVQFINIDPSNPIKHLLTKPTYVHVVTAYANLEEFVKFGYDYYPASAGCLKEGQYNWVARVIDPKGDVVLAQVHDHHSGIYHLNMTVK